MAQEHIIFFGVNSKKEADHLRMTAKLQGITNLPVTAVYRASEIILPKGTVTCQLAFTHYVPGKRGQRSTGAELQSWGARFTKPVKNTVLAHPTPTVDWFTSMDDSSVTLNIAWKAVETDHVIEVAKKLESAYIDLGGSSYPSSGLNQAKTTNAKDGCFIATAAMGDYEHPNVIELRRFRDDYLNKHWYGQQFIATYYRLSPPLARIIARYAILRKISRWMIVQPAVLLAKRLRKDIR
ncbi:hypothetical protein TI04_02625 [Achromatium sp. WMS2]|nr:hypothetical protein TI04_02625 [Achromatium sp. WMS2]